MTQFSNSISYITLGVDDLERSLRFYRDGLGLATKGIIGSEHNHGAVVFLIFSPACDLPCGHVKVLAQNVMLVCQRQTLAALCWRTMSVSAAMSIR